MYKINSSANQQVYDHTQPYSFENIDAYDLIVIPSTEWQITGVSYKWDTNKVFIHVQFSWDGWLNCAERIYIFDCPGTWTDADAYNALIALPEFENTVNV